MAHLVMVTTPELAAGLALAGVRVSVAETPQQAAEALARHVDDPDVGVVGVHAPYLDALDAPTRRRYEDSVAPVVVRVPAGSGEAGAAHRARLASLLQRAIGFRISFGGEEEK